MRLFAMWASRIPTDARTNSPQSKPRSLTPRSPAMSAAVSVMGRTAARVRTSQRDTGSTWPSGGFVVARTVRQFASRLRRWATCAMLRCLAPCRQFHQAVVGGLPRRALEDGGLHAPLGEDGQERSRFDQLGETAGAREDQPSLADPRGSEGGDRAGGDGRSVDGAQDVLVVGRAPPSAHLDARVAQAALWLRP